MSEISPAGAVPTRKKTAAISLVPNKRAAVDREFLPAALEIIETPASPVGRAIGLLIVAAALTAIIWSSLSKVDIVTSAPGKVVPVGRSKIVQPFETGIVTAINVSDGDLVKAGEVLVVLDSTSARAGVFRYSEELTQAELDAARLQGLQAQIRNGGTPVLVDAPVTASVEALSEASAQMQSQYAEQVGKLADLDQQIAEKRAEVQQAVATIDKVETDKPFLGQVAAMRTTLMQDQVGNKLDWLSAENQLADTGPNIALAQAQEASAAAAAAALTQERSEAQAEYSKEVLSDLEKSGQQMIEADQDLVKADQEVDYATLRAPVDGSVQQIAVHTIGGVVAAGQPLMTVVPADTGLVVQASVKNQDIGFVHVGQIVDVKVGAFDFTKYGDIKGTVESISGDVFDPSPNLAPASDGYGNGAESSDPGEPPQPAGVAAPQEPEYLVYIALSRTDIATDTGLARLQPGMAVTADIKTGRRTVISYLLSPFQHKVDDAARER